jgi:hypothetical protein
MGGRGRGGEGGRGNQGGSGGQDKEKDNKAKKSKRGSKRRKTVSDVERLSAECDVTEEAAQVLPFSQSPVIRLQNLEKWSLAPH